MLCTYNLSPNQCLLIHQPWHFDLVPAVVRHFEIAKKRGIGDGSLSESAADILDGVFYFFKAVETVVVHKKRKLIRLALRDKIDGTHGHSPHICLPLVILQKDTVGSSCTVCAH